MAGSGHHTSLFTINRDDVYDYLRCPKIVAFKAMLTMRNLNQPSTKPKSMVPRFELGKEPQTIGRAAELAVETAFSLKSVDKETAPEMQEASEIDQTLQRRLTTEISPQRLTAYVRVLATDALKNAIKLRVGIEENYGNLRLLGRCESRNPLGPSKVQPDFVAFAEGTQRAILLESKGSVSKSKRDQFQASYYNGIAGKFGVMLIKERTERGRHTIAPLVRFNQPAETLILYSRRGEFEKIKESILVDRKLAHEIWEAKQLGMKGKLPETDCGPTCPHNRFRVTAEEDTLEPAVPLPLVFARGYYDLDYALDILYQTNLAYSAMPSNVAEELFWGNLSSDSRNKLSTWLVENLGLSPRLAVRFANQRTMQERPDAKKVIRTMASEIEPWKMIFKKRFKISAPVNQGLATSFFALPRDSNRLIKAAWRRWRK
jgi:hypothetical protein